jgi:ATP-binding protein involved in chromosome partitioning
VAYDVADITVERDRSVTVVYADGVTHEFELIELRLHCPCAGCRNDRERGRAPWSPPREGATPAIRDASLIGAWGLSVQWDDGHRAGIYPFDALREWGDGRRHGVLPDGVF